jgi:hypothetical protein
MIQGLIEQFHKQVGNSYQIIVHKNAKVPQDYYEHLNTRLLETTRSYQPKSLCPVTPPSLAYMYGEFPNIAKAEYSFCQSVLFRKIINVFSAIHTKHKNALCDQNVKFLNVKTAGT